MYLYINAYIFIEPLPRTAGLASSVHSSSREPAGQTPRWSCRRPGRTPPGTGGAERRWESTEREQLEDDRWRLGAGAGRRGPWVFPLAVPCLAQTRRRVG